MMQSPDSYYESHLNDDLDTLLKERILLYHDMHFYERVCILSDIGIGNETVMPSPHTKYQMNNLYLVELTKLIEQKMIEKSFLKRLFLKKKDIDQETINRFKNEIDNMLLKDLVTKRETLIEELKRQENSKHMDMNVYQLDSSYLKIISEKIYHAFKYKNLNPKHAFEKTILAAFNNFKEGQMKLSEKTLTDAIKEISKSEDQVFWRELSNNYLKKLLLNNFKEGKCVSVDDIINQLKEMSSFRSPLEKYQEYFVKTDLEDFSLSDPSLLHDEQIESVVKDVLIPMLTNLK